MVPTVWVQHRNRYLSIQILNLIEGPVLVLISQILPKIAKTSQKKEKKE